MICVPNQGSPRGTQGLYVRVAGDSMSYVDSVRGAVWSVDSAQPVAEITPMSALVGMWVAIPRATRTLVGMLAGLAAMLAVVGIFVVVSYAVRTRRRCRGRGCPGRAEEG